MAPKTGNFSKAPLVRRHKGATFGIVGLGRIGLATARRAAGFDMKVVFYDPHLSGVDLSTGYERVHSHDNVRRPRRPEIGDRNSASALPLRRLMVIGIT